MKEFRALTGIRIVVAWMVFFYHIFNSHSFIIREFYVGVGMFFVLSGFLISYRYYDEFPGWKKYMINRFARIYPIFFFIVTFSFFMFIFFSVGPFQAPSEYLFAITFTNTFSKDLIFSGVAQAWSLTLEECFYLSAPILFLLLAQKKIWIIFLLFLLANIGLGLIYNDYNFVFNRTYPGCFSQFFAGICLFFAYKRGLHSGHKTYIGLGFISLCIYLMTLSSTPDTIGINHYSGIAINNILMPIAVAIFYAGLISEDTLISRLLSTNLFDVLGRASYCFYLVHWGVFSETFLYYINNKLLLFIFINILSCLLWKYLEEPTNKFVKKALTAGIKITWIPKISINIKDGPEYKKISFESKLT